MEFGRMFIFNKTLTKAGPVTIQRWVFVILYTINSKARYILFLKT
jgi:hypothetical protein